MISVKTGYNLAGTMYHEYDYVNNNGVRVVIVSWPTQPILGYKVNRYPNRFMGRLNTLAEALERADKLT